MEHPIGKPFKVNGVFYIAVGDRDEGSRCDRCAANSFCGLSGDVGATFGSCAPYRRKDRKSVRFEQFGVDF